MRRVLILIGPAIMLSLVLGYALGAKAQERAVRIVVNGKEIHCDPPAFIKDNRTFVPVRFVAEALGARVEWDEINYTVAISTAIQNSFSEAELQNYFPGRVIMERLSAKFPDKQIEGGLGLSANVLFIDGKRIELPRRIIDRKLYFSVKPLIEAGYWD